MASTKSTRPRTRHYIDFTNGVFEAIGLDYKAQTLSLIMNALEGFQYFRMFLDQIFIAVIIGPRRLVPFDQIYLILCESPMRHNDTEVRSQLTLHIIDLVHRH
eukprot:NODE_367_length_1429_cov_7.260870_g271_i0.p2 GENE.NODE_367_length_1429_cov_7.260870_g271_i0~~NODE_367_length_1429_cov_7.260870_g271_i0.p2  ORF type:complete len:103 (-),score=5.35 NODE_367_length_1429_cov_7.260870_g271_i0:730-1038(-)